jgi:hypothetical protein
MRRKEDIFLRQRGTPSIFFCSMPVRQKGRDGGKWPERPDIAFYRPQHARPGSGPNFHGCRSDKSATI